MPQYNLHIKDGKQVKVAIDATNSHEAIDSGVTALAQFAFRNFPPPENLSIAITDNAENPVATVSFAFKIDYAPGIVT
jgi:hypothetical protein